MIYWRKLAILGENGVSASAIAQLLAVAALWGSSFVITKVGVAGIGPMGFAWARIVLATLTLAVVLRLRGTPFPQGRRTWLRLSVMGLIGTALPFAMITWGMQYIDGGLGSVLNAIQPLFTFLIAAALGDERLRWLRGAGLLLGFAGTLVLTIPSWGGGLRLNLLGEMAVIAASVSYALGAVYAARILSDESPLSISFGQVATSTIWLLPMLLIEGLPTAAPNGITVATILYSGIASTALALIFYYNLLLRYGATSASSVTYVTPLFGLLTGWILLGETPTWHVILALALIFGGLLLVNRPTRSQARAD